MSTYPTTAVPTARQLEYQDWEMGLFLHFGIRTFYEGHRDWDGKPMFPEAFRPSAFDPEDWVLAARDAGMEYLVLTAKHHDGFANWPSKYTEFSVASSPWRDGQGDVVRDFIAACRKHDMHPGLYYSPAEAGETFKADAKAYDDYFINQISEILEPYGPIDVLWFDGCGSADHEYDWVRITDEIRRMQPEVQIFSMGADPNFRWVGNESGIAPVPCWNTARDDVFGKLGDQAPLKWLPAECDCRMREANWFYSDQDEDTVKSLEQLMGLYYYSVGRGCNLLINIGPDRRGLLPDKDGQRLLEFGEEVRRRFGQPLARLDDFSARTPAKGSVPGGAGAAGPHGTDPDVTAGTVPDEAGDSPLVWTYVPEKPFLLDHMVVQEDLANGEHVRRFAIEAYVGGGPADWITLWEGYNIGHKAICRFPLLQAYQVRLRVTEADGEVRLRALELHNST